MMNNNNSNNVHPVGLASRRRRTLSGNKNSILLQEQSVKIRNQANQLTPDTFSLRTASVFFFVAFIWHSTLLPSFYKMAGPEIAARISLSGMHVDAFKDPQNLDPKILREFGLAAAASHTIVFLFGILAATALRTVRFSSIVRSEGGRAEPIGIGVSLVLIVWTASVFHVLAQAFARYAFETKFGPVYNYATIFYKTAGGESPFAWASSVSFTTALIMGFVMSSDIYYNRFEKLFLGPFRGAIATGMASIIIPFMIWLGLIDYFIKPFFGEDELKKNDTKTAFDAEHAFAFAVGLVMMSMGSTTKLIKDTCCADDVGAGALKRPIDIITNQKPTEVEKEQEEQEEEEEDYSQTFDMDNLIRTLKTLVATFTLSCTLLASSLISQDDAFDVVVTTLWRPILLGLFFVFLSWLATFAYMRLSFTTFLLSLSPQNPIRRFFRMCLLIVLWNVHMFPFFGCWVPFHLFSAFLSNTKLLPNENYTQLDAFADGFLYAFTGPYFGPVLCQGSLKILNARLKLKWGLVQESILATLILLPPCMMVYYNWTKVSIPVHIFMSASEVLYLLTWRGRPEYSGWRDWPALKQSRIWYLLEEYFSVRYIVESANVDTARGDLDSLNGEAHWDPLTIVDRKKGFLPGFEPGKARILCFAPHGMFPCTVVWMHLLPLWARVFKSLIPHALTDSFTHVPPGMREVMQWAGGREIDKEIMQSMLRLGKTIIIVPGGQEEIFLHSNENYAKKKMCLAASHRGFLKVGMQMESDFVPMISFGELDAIKNVNLPTIQGFFRKYFGAPVPFIPVGIGGVFPVPRMVPFTLVFGKPLKFKVKTPGKPTDEEVAAAYLEYYSEVQRLFDDYKDTAGYGDWELELVGFDTEKNLVREISRKFS